MEMAGKEDLQVGIDELQTNGAAEGAAAAEEEKFRRLFSDVL